MDKWNVPLCVCVMFACGCWWLIWKTVRCSAYSVTYIIIPVKIVSWIQVSQQSVYSQLKQKPKRAKNEEEEEEGEKNTVKNTHHFCQYWQLAHIVPRRISRVYDPNPFTTVAAFTHSSSTLFTFWEMHFSFYATNGTPYAIRDIERGTSAAGVGRKCMQE